MSNNELNISAESYTQEPSNSVRAFGSAPVRQENASGEDWMSGARCKDVPPETFFPSDGAGVPVAKHYCAECPVRPQCLEYALKEDIEHGVWGGASERERRKIQNQRRSFGRYSKNGHVSVRDTTDL